MPLLDRQTLKLGRKQSFLLYGTTMYTDNADMAHIKLGSQYYGKNAQHAFDVMLKRKDRFDFYPCVADAPLGTSDRTCHKFIAETVRMIFVQTSLNAW